MAFRTLATAALLASAAMARTDLVGCTSYDTVATPKNGGTPYATRIWYVPDSGELCDFLDCGGGRAPPKTTVPGCAAYSGTETYSPSFINPATLGGHVPVKTTSAIAASSTHVGDETSFKTTTTADAKETTATAKSSSSDDDEDKDSSTITDKATTDDATATDATATATATATASASASNASASDASESKGTNTASGSKETASATTSSAKADSTGAAAAVHGGAVLGTCLVAGAAACFALL